MYKTCFKRFFDVTASCLLLIMLFPLFLLIGLLVRIFLGSPVIFKQIRPGLNEKPFYLYKFRTMRDQYDSNNHLLDDDKRLTKFGILLRSLSLDELPELLNILKNDMSLVGPRPLLMEYLPFYSEEQRLRHSVKPGITGWAQVNGRNLLSWDKKFELDVWYVKNYSFSLDIKILFLTLIKIIKRDDINAVGCATMSRFDLEVKRIKKEIS